MPAGYSGTPLARKLGIRDGLTVFLDRVPDDVDLGLDPDPVSGAQVVRRLPATADLTLTFHTQAATLRDRLPTLIEHTAAAGMVWVCWPKKSARRSPRNPEGPVSDLDENLVRELALGLGVVDVKVAAIDETWSGLKLVRRLSDR